MQNQSPPDLTKMMAELNLSSDLVPDEAEKSRIRIYNDAYQKGQQSAKDQQLSLKLKSKIKPEFGTEKYYEIEVQKAQEAVVRKELQAVVRQELYANPNMLPDFKCLRSLKLHIEQMNGVNTASKYIFICVSPDSRDSSQNIEYLIKLVDKAVHKVWIQDWLMTFEQRGACGTKELGTGIHMNFLIKKAESHLKKAPTDMAREFRNTFKSVIGDNCFSAVDYRYSNDPTNFLNYFAGVKDEGHDPEVILGDREWREQLGILPYFCSSGWLEHFQALKDYPRAFYLDEQK